MINYLLGFGYSEMAITKESILLDNHIKEYFQF